MQRVLEVVGLVVAGAALSMWVLYIIGREVWAVICKVLQIGRDRL